MYISFINDFERLEHELSELCESGELDYMPMKLKSILFEIILYLADHDQQLHSSASTARDEE